MSTRLKILGHLRQRDLYGYEFKQVQFCEAGDHGSEARRLLGLHGTFNHEGAPTARPVL